MTRRYLCVAMIGILGCVGCGGDDEDPKSPTAPSGSATTARSTPGHTSVVFETTSNTCSCWAKTVKVTVGAASKSMSCKSGSRQSFDDLPAATHRVSACGDGCEYSSAEANMATTFRLICVSAPNNVQPGMLITVD